ncbi:MAG: SusC/RagA family TonB-linked outer membrane protein [Flavobacterium sp.]|nr:MAG: SusC/RagA family TonB-linked outer membrane protein [Flavobacterium sp.]
MRSKFKWIFTLLLALSMQFSFAQEKTVTGVVSDPSGPIPGANVVVKGTNRGTQTDIDGKYSISAKVGEVLVFSYVGMSDFQATVGAANVINAKLTEGLQLQEVIVTGALGIRRIRDAVPSSQQVVKAAEITQANNPNAVIALTGKVSGLTINTTNVGVNNTTRVVLRGNRSLTGNNQALVVIDNAISSITVLQTIAPELIESMNVIKGPQGAALYGSDGVNGVIIVTTKRGNKTGKVAVNVTSAIDFEQVAFVPQRQLRYGQGWSGTHVNYENGAWGAEFDGVPRPTGMAQADGSYIVVPYSPIEDNIKKFFSTGSVMQNGFSVSAGDESGYALASVNKQNTEFVVKNDKLDKTSALFKGGKKLGRWSIDGVVNYYTQRVQSTSSTLFTELLQAASNIPVERFSTPRNEYHWTSYYRSPYWMRENIRNEANTDFVSGSIALNYKLNDHINFNYNVNTQVIQTNALSYTNEYIDVLQIGGGDNTTISTFDTSNQNNRNIYADFLINLDYKLAEKVGLKANVGNNIQDRYLQFTSVGGDNLTIPGYYNISNVQGQPRTNNTFQRRRSYSFFANIDLAYDDYLFLNLTGRNDWTSTLSSDNNNYFYPSAGLSFIPTKAFASLEDNKVVNYAKIAVSWTRNGNTTSVAPYAINNLYTQALGYPFGDLNSFVQTSGVTDQNIRPEFYVTKDFTVNLEMFDSRLNLDVSAYRTDNTDLITAISPSYTSGLTSAVTNVGASHTTGLELDLGFTPINMKDLGLKWTNKLSYSTNKTIVDKVTDQSTSVALANFATSGGIGIFAEEGEEFPLIKGIGYQRDDQGRVIIDPATGNPMKTTDYIKLGVANPDYVLNYSTSVEFKGFTLAAVMDYRTGGQFWSGSKQWLSWSGHLYDSATNGRTGFIFPNSSIPDAANPGQYVQNTNVVTAGTTYGEYITYFQDEYAETAENFVLDATAFKVRELSLSYSFKSDLISRAGMSALKIGVNARNPFIVLPTENRNYSDPEQSRSSGNDQGIAAVGQYPQTRTFGFSVNVTF